MNKNLLFILGFVSLYCMLGGVDFFILFYLIYRFSVWKIILYIIFYIVVVKLIKIKPNKKFQTFYYDFYSKWLRNITFHWDEKVKEKLFGTKDKIMICYHPHAVLCLAAWFNGLVHPELKIIPLNVFSHPTIHKIPVISIMARLLGAKSVNGKNLNNVMKKSTTPIGMVPGGGDEMLFSKPGLHKLFIKERKGFIKYSLRYGYSLVPVFTFGDTELYNVPFLLPNKTKKQRHISMHFFLLGHFLFVRGWLYIFGVPKRKPVHSFMGKIVHFPLLPKPQQSDIDYYHELYVKELLAIRKKGIKIMKEDKEKYGDVDYGKLELV